MTVVTSVGTGAVSSRMCLLETRASVGWMIHSVLAHSLFAIFVHGTNKAKVAGETAAEPFGAIERFNRHDSLLVRLKLHQRIALHE